MGPCLMGTRLQASHDYSEIREFLPDITQYQPSAHTSDQQSQVLNSPVTPQLPILPQLRDYHHSDDTSVALSPLPHSQIVSVNEIEGDIIDDHTYHILQLSGYTSSDNTSEVVDTAVKGSVVLGVEGAPADLAPSPETAVGSKPGEEEYSRLVCASKSNGVPEVNVDDADYSRLVRVIAGLALPRDCSADAVDIQSDTTLVVGSERSIASSLNSPHLIDGPHLTSSQDGLHLTPSQDGPHLTPSQDGPHLTPSQGGPHLTPSQDGPHLTPSQDGPHLTPSQDGPHLTPSQDGPHLTPSQDGPHLTPSQDGPHLTPSQGAHVPLAPPSPHGVDGQVSEDVPPLEAQEDDEGHSTAELLRYKGDYERDPAYMAALQWASVRQGTNYVNQAILDDARHITTVVSGVPGVTMWQSSESLCPEAHVYQALLTRTREKCKQYTDVQLDGDQSRSCKDVQLDGDQSRPCKDLQLDGDQSRPCMDLQLDGDQSRPCKDLQLGGDQLTQYTDLQTV